MVIVKDYILKEINEKMGFSDTVRLTDEIIEYIIETYTLEPGVRKLKEVLFDLFGEINLELLRCTNENIVIPIDISIGDLDTKYLKKYHKVQETKIPAKSALGIIKNYNFFNTLNEKNKKREESKLAIEFKTYMLYPGKLSPFDDVDSVYKEAYNFLKINFIPKETLDEACIFNEEKQTYPSLESVILKVSIINYYYNCIVIIY